MSTVEKMKIASSLKEDADVAIDMPAKLTENSKWSSWEAQLDNYLGSKRNHNGEPLNYVIRAEFDPVTDPAILAALETDTERLYVSAVLEGGTFKVDNEMVLRIIVQLTLGNPVHTYVERYARTKNGRGALTNLRNHFEGTSAVKVSKEEAIASLRTMSYTGEKSNFKFATFVTRHQR
jgi:hypothetical protein